MLYNRHPLTTVSHVSIPSLGLQRPQLLDVAADPAHVGGDLRHLVEELLQVHLGVGFLSKVYDGPRLKYIEDIQEEE